jgi:hypothetical protein
LCCSYHESLSRADQAFRPQRPCVVLYSASQGQVHFGLRERRHTSPLDAKDHDPLRCGPQVHRRVHSAGCLLQSHRRRLGGGSRAQDGNVEVIRHMEPILQPISALNGTWPHIPCCWLTCCTVTQTLHTQPPADTGFSRWGVVPLRVVNDVVGTHPEAKEHSVSRWLTQPSPPVCQ